MIIKNYKIIPNFEYNSLVKSREQLAKLQHTMSKLSDRADFLNTIMDHIGDHQETLLDMYVQLIAIQYLCHQVILWMM